MTPTPEPSPSAQPQRTALRLSIEDEAIALRFHLRHGANWLLKDFQAGVGKLEQLRAPGSSQLSKLQHFVESAVQATGLALQTAQDAAAVVASPQAPYRDLDFQLLPLAAYFRTADTRNPSRVFTHVFYWLIRHALDMRAAPGLLVRQRLVDEAYWVMVARGASHIKHLNPNPAEGGAGDPQDRHTLCAWLLEALLKTRPVYDGGCPPWTERALARASYAEAFASMLSAVVAVGLASDSSHRDGGTDASDRLRFANDLVNARLSSFEAAAKKDNATGALAAELAFLLRHA